MQIVLKHEMSELYFSGKKWKKKTSSVNICWIWESGKGKYLGRHGWMRQLSTLYTQIKLANVHHLINMVLDEVFFFFNQNDQLFVFISP